jgi:hypothetical protein
MNRRFPTQHFPKLYWRVYCAMGHGERCFRAYSDAHLREMPRHEWRFVSEYARLGRMTVVNL